MLNQRQIEILLTMSNSPDVFFTASRFVEEHQVSLRTIQSDIKIIKESLEKELCACINSKPAKGSCLHINDYEDFSAFMSSLYQKYTNMSLSHPISRINNIILLLLNRHRPVSLLTIEDEMYISHSTLMNDLKKAGEILKKFQLELLKSGNKIFIDGLEINKRRYLIEKSMDITHYQQGKTYIDERQILHIKNILTEVFVQYGHHIGETDFKNAILLLNTMIKRMKDGFYIPHGEIETIDFHCKAMEISAELFKRLEHRFFFDATQEEIEYFSLYLQGQGTFEDSELISPKMDNFITEAFIKINEVFNIDFTDNINLRISLALHCVPLSIRVKYNMQVKNEMLEYIKKTFPLGYDIGTYFAFLLEQEYGNKVTDDEIALLAVHFYSSLIELHHKTGNKRVDFFPVKRYTK